MAWKRGTGLSALLLLALLLSGCGGDDAPVAAPAPVADAPPVDPAALDVDAAAEPEAETEEPPPEWNPPSTVIAKAQWRTSLREAAAALAEGRLERVGEQDGALELYLGILAADPKHVEASAGVDQVLSALVEQGGKATIEGRLPEAARIGLIVGTLRPEHPALATYGSRLEVARRAATLVRRAEKHADAGRLLAPEGRNAVASYREALGHLPDFLPAQQGLARLQGDRLTRALAAAQGGDYAGSDQRLSEAARILPDSGATQDMAARIVELRQARTAHLLAQGEAAVEVLDLDLAQRRLEEARKVSVQGQGLDALAERIELARHYGRHAPRQVFRDALAAGGDGPEMVVMPHGRFQLGSPDNEAQRQDNEGPRHAVVFKRGFALARNETTVGEFRRFVQETNYRSVAQQRGRSTVYDEKGGSLAEHKGVDWRRDHAGAAASDQLPVVHVAFADAEAYATWLSAQTGQRYRLPSEAEFEYALRAGGDSAWPWGNGPPPAVVGNLTGAGDRSRLGRTWSNAIPGYSDGHWGPAPVRSYPVEAFGTFDLIGNVSEWVQDCWHDSYGRAPADGSAWVNAGCEERVLRGASWASSLDRVRSAYRQSANAGTTHARVGFRLVREL